MNQPQRPTPIVTSDDDWDLSLKACATQVFRWMRQASDVLEESPAYLKSISDDLLQAWQDSAKR